MTSDIPFIETSVYRIIESVADRALRLHWTAVITGAPGVGKTRALQELAERRPAVDGGGRAAVTIIEVNSSLGQTARGLITVVANALGYSWYHSSYETLRDIRPRDNEILIFDEAQNIKANLLRDLLTLNENRGLAMMFCGNDRMLKYTHSADSALEQIGSRFHLTENILGVSADDADRITNYFNVEDKAVYLKMRDIAAVRHARGVVKVLRLAQDIAGARQPIRMSHVEDALDQIPHLSRAVPSRRPGVSKRVPSNP
jgi:DNA transposition AAA+ family ATPase